MRPLHAINRPCALFWLAVVTSVLLLLLAVLLPWASRLSSLERSVELSRDQVARYQRLVSRLPAIREALEQERASDDFEDLSFSAETPALAGAQLQRDLQEMVREVDARPISAQILPVDARAQPPRVSVRIQLQSDTAALLELLLKIEQARPLLFVDQMSVRSSARDTTREVGPRFRGRRANPTPEDVLTVRLDVYGYSLVST